jgi:hypothetical protein
MVPAKADGAKTGGFRQGPLNPATNRRQTKVKPRRDAIRFLAPAPNHRTCLAKVHQVLAKVQVLLETAKSLHGGGGLALPIPLSRVGINVGDSAANAGLGVASEQVSAVAAAFNLSEKNKTCRRASSHLPWAPKNEGGQSPARTSCPPPTAGSP